MAKNNWFAFKQFRVEQQKAAMKVGTDGVLLGAWAPVEGCRRILEIGTGTGVVALMLAQRSVAMIDAIEIDPLACEEARFNFEKSPWSDRLSLYSADFTTWAGAGVDYDLVVSNPPYFSNSVRGTNRAKAMARHDDTLTFYQLIEGAFKVLRPEGRLCVILPYSCEMEFRESARLAGFFLVGLTKVYPREHGQPKRVLLELSLKPALPREEQITILSADGTYTPAYRQLTAPFYPAF